MDLIAIVRSVLAAFARRPALWPIGVIAVIAGQGAGPISWLSVELRAVPTLQAATVQALLQINAGTLIVFAAGLLALGVVQSAAGALLQGTLIALVAPEAAPSLGDALQAAVRRFRPLFVVRLLIGVSVLAPALLTLAAVIVVVAVATTGIDLPEGTRAALALMVLCLVPLFLLIALSALALGVVETLAMRACMLSDAGALAAMRRGWRLLRKRSVPVAGLWLTALVLGAAGGFVAGLIATELTRPAVTALVLGEPLAAVLAARLAVAYALVLATGGALTALQSAIWTRGYQVITAAAAPLGA